MRQLLSSMTEMLRVFFFFQAEDGIRDYKVTGVQTCALPISWTRSSAPKEAFDLNFAEPHRAGKRNFFAGPKRNPGQIGRASCREKSVDLGGRRIIKKKKQYLYCTNVISKV